MLTTSRLNIDNYNHSSRVPSLYESVSIASNGSGAAVEMITMQDDDVP